jgi:hypothetical protein
LLCLLEFTGRCPDRQHRHQAGCIDPVTTFTCLPCLADKGDGMDITEWVKRNNFAPAQCENTTLHCTADKDTPEHRREVGRIAIDCGFFDF